MSEQRFEDRVARLEEHIVTPRRLTAEEWLDRAEEYLAKGWDGHARHSLTLAQLRHQDDEPILDESGAEGDDDA